MIANRVKRASINSQPSKIVVRNTRPAMMDEYWIRWMSAITWFTDEKTFAVATPKDAQNVDTMRRDDRWDTLTCVQKLTASQLNLPHGTENKKGKEQKTKTDIAQKIRSPRKSVESVLRKEQSLRWEGFVKHVKQVGFKPGTKMWGSFFLSYFHSFFLS